MIDLDAAHRFANEWIAAWNAHDLPRVLSHYHDDFEMSSPRIRDIANEPSGTLRGKDAVGRYWSMALQLIPNLHFTPIAVCAGVGSVAIHYKNERDRLAIEVFELDQDHKVVRAFAHY